LEDLSADGGMILKVIIKKNIIGFVDWIQPPQGTVMGQDFVNTVVNIFVAHNAENY
jgi:hypothetical protein